MDAKYYNGPDERELSDPPDAEDCPGCHAGPLEECAKDCECDACLTMLRKVLAAAWRVSR